MTKQILIEEWNIDFEEYSAEFTIENLVDEDLSLVLEVSIEYYSNPDNPICVIEDVLNTRLVVDGVTEVPMDDIDDVEIDLVNSILSKEYIKHLKN